MIQELQAEHEKEVADVQKRLDNSQTDRQGLSEPPESHAAILLRMYHHHIATLPCCIALRCNN